GSAGCSMMTISVESVILRSGIGVMNCYRPIADYKRLGYTCQEYYLLVISMLNSVPKIQHSSLMRTSAQIRAARALLDLRHANLAKESGVAEVTIKKIERGGIDPRASTLDALQRAFDKAGVVCFESGDMRDGGDGVRFKKPTRGKR